MFTFMLMLFSKYKPCLNFLFSNLDAILALPENASEQGLELYLQYQAPRIKL